MTPQPESWHHGLVADWWSEFAVVLEPGGTLLLDKEVPYADARRWRTGRAPKHFRSRGPRPSRGASRTEASSACGIA